MWQRKWSVARGNLTVVLCSYYMLIFTGLSMSCTNSAWWCADARTALLHSTWQHTEHQSLRLHHDSISETASWQHLRLAASHQLTVLPHRCVTYGGRAYAVASPSTWNSLPKRLHEPSNSATVFGHLLKTFFFWEYFGEMCYINRRFTLHYITLLSCDRQTNRAIASTRTSIASCR